MAGKIKLSNGDQGKKREVKISGWKKWKIMDRNHRIGGKKNEAAYLRITNHN